MARPRFELIDASAWIEFLRATGSPADIAVTERIQSDADLAITGPIAMELLAGTRDDEAREIKRALAACRMLPVEAQDWESAASVYRTCRRGGVTPRSLLDCLIAAVALRNGAAILAQDRDFELIARQVPLELSA